MAIATGVATVVTVVAIATFVDVLQFLSLLLSVIVIVIVMVIIFIYNHGTISLIEYLEKGKITKNSDHPISHRSCTQYIQKQ